MKKIETITPYTDNASKQEQITTAFNTIAPRYDFMNRLLSLGIDVLWRQKALRSIGSSAPENILDLATGTGDFALMAARKFPGARITGIDLSDRMLEIANTKIRAKKFPQAIEFIRADCLQTPFPENKFDLATLAFGIRNFADLDAGCREINRILKPGGRILILELSRPSNRLISALYNFYLKHIIPALGHIFSGSQREYTYLQESIRHVPQAEEMLDILRQAGFINDDVQRYTFGICSCYTAERASASA